MTKNSTHAKHVLGSLTLVAAASPLHAGIDRIWNGPITQSSWHTAGNWTPTGIPGTGDSVAIMQTADVRLNSGTQFIENLFLSGGGLLNTNTYTVSASDLVSIGAGGRLEAMFAFGSDAVVAPRILLPAGGTLDLLGGIVHATDTFHSQGLITGHGTLRLDTVPAPLFRNEGTITSTGVIEIDVEDGTVVLDGFVNIGDDASLVIDAGETTIDGGVEMTGDSTIDVAGPWSMNAFLGVDSGDGEAEINGDALTIGVSAQGSVAGTVNINAPLTLRARLFTEGTLSFGAPARIETSGRLKLAETDVFGSEITLVGSGQIHGHGHVYADQIVNEGQIIAEGGTLTIDTVAPQPDLDGNGVGFLSATFGDIEILASGGAAYDVGVFVGEGREIRMPGFSLGLAANSYPPPQLSNYIRIRGGTIAGGGILQTMYSGPIEILASPEEALIRATADTFLAGDVGLEGDLRVEGDTHLRPTLNMYGPGLLTVDTNGRLHLQPGTSPEVAIRNEGEIVVGDMNEIGVNSFGRFLDQQATGTLSFEFQNAGNSFDRLEFDGIAQLGGTLRVDALDGSSLNQPITILSAAAIEGMFQHVEIPTDATIVYTSTGVVVQPASLCTSDINGDGVINFSDLLEVLNAWGFCCGCPADVTNDGQINITDLIHVLANWGPCE